MVPMVAMNGGIFASPTSAPLMNPKIAPTARAVRIMARIEFVMLKTTIHALVVNTSEEPIERSICPVSTTSAIPIAMVPMIQVFCELSIAVMWLHLKLLPFAEMVNA